MASPMCCGFELGNAHSRAGIGHALGWAIVPGLNYRTCISVEPKGEREVVPRKGSEVRNENPIGHFAVRGRRGRAVGSHSLPNLRASVRGGFNNQWRSGSIGSVFRVVSGSPNKSFQRTPNTPRQLAHGFAMLAQATAPRSAPLN